MIPVSIPHKEVIKNFFETDIQMMKRYYNGIAFAFDDDFRFDIFKEFIYAAAGMFKDILRNVVPDSLANVEHKERLLDAKRYCEKINR